MLPLGAYREETVYNVKPLNNGIMKQNPFNNRPSCRDNYRSSFSMFAFSKPLQGVQVCKATPDGDLIRLERKH